MLHSSLAFLAYSVLFLLALTAPSPASAADSQAVHVTYTVPSNLSVEEKKWYETFQKGNMLADGWVHISTDILTRIPAAEREPRQKKLLQLGDKIGREWCKDNKTRKINTDMLKKWGKILKDASRKSPGELDLALAHINRLVDGALKK